MKKMTIETPDGKKLVCEVDNEAMPMPQQTTQPKVFVGEVVRITAGAHSCTVVVRNECEVNLSDQPEWLFVGTKVLVDINNLTIKPLK